MKTKLYNLIAWLWFFGVLAGNLLLMIVVIIMVAFGNIWGMLKSGFSVPTVGFTFCILIGMVFTITGWVPVFRRCYYMLPWLYPFSMILMMHLYILSIAETILSKGFQIMNTPRHVITIILVVVQMVLCRAAMCVYLKKYPMVLYKYDRVE